MKATYILSLLNKLYGSLHIKNTDALLENMSVELEKKYVEFVEVSKLNKSDLMSLKHLFEAKSNKMLQFFNRNVKNSIYFNFLKEFIFSFPLKIRIDRVLFGNK